MKVDLHVHTNISDSSLSTEETIKLAKERGLTHIAMTNHDTVNGLQEAIELGKKYGIIVIPGIEISAYDFKRQTKAHILGYNFDLNAPHIKKLVQVTNELRDANTKAQLQILIEAGYNLSYEDVLEKAQHSTAFYKQHLVDVLTSKGYDRKDLKPLFAKGGICDRGISYVDAFKAVEAIKLDGGIAVMAHPGQSKTFELIEDLALRGLDGIEKYHPDHTEADHQLIDALLVKHKLISTTGSDFHAAYGRNRPFGTLTQDYLPF
ncbi:MAG: PHP domain-containing protein [Turicibacter sp.]